MTKSLTALCIVQLAEADKLSLTDAVSLWLPEWELDDERKTSLTIHHLLTHTSGLPGMQALAHARAASVRNDPDWPLVVAALGGGPDPASLVEYIQTVKDLITLLNAQPIQWLAEPERVFNYSNEGYALLQEIIERASGKSYVAYVKEHVFDVIGMASSTFLLPELTNFPEVTELYAMKVTEGKPEVFHSPAWWDVAEIYANGSLMSNASDMVKYLQVWSGEGQIKGQSLISAASWETLTRSHIEMPSGQFYGYGVHITPSYHGVTVVEHGGAIKGVSSQIMVCPNKDVTVLVLSNMAGLPVHQYALAALNTVLGLPINEQLVTYLPFPSKEPKRLERFSGTYVSQEGPRVNISVQDDGLVAEVQHLRLPLLPYSDTGFVTPDGKVPVVFLSNGNTTASALFLGERILPKVN